jgi:hypothetical protein
VFRQLAGQAFVITSLKRCLAGGTDAFFGTVAAMSFFPLAFGTECRFFFLGVAAILGSVF